MALLRLKNIHIATDDAGELADFWQQAIGLSPRFRDADRWIQLQAGENPFAIASLAEGVPDQRGAVPVFEVDDLEAHSTAISEHGGRVISVRDMGSHGRVLTFSDPDGNIGQLQVSATNSG
jgi:predicted enzyme related to lactoylglutathione lyase